jgi:glycosyltransferase involved in cell wall biosynthesis
LQDRPLRILYHHRIAASDGMRVHITEVVDALRARGHEILVVGPSAGKAEAAAGAESRFERLADRLRHWLPATAVEVLELLYNLAAYPRLAAAARAFKPDVLYERYNLFLLAGLWLRARLGLPMLLEINSPLAEERTALKQLRLQRLGRACQAALWRGADAALPVTRVLAGEVEKVRHPHAALQVVHNGANLRGRPSPVTPAEVRRRLGIPPTALVFGFAGFVRAWHRVDWALDALPDLPVEGHLVLVGDGPALASLNERASELGLGHRFHVVGRIPHHEVAVYMQAFDVALQTAAVSYASPLKLFEYMGLGLTIIAPDQPNIREVLQGGENAILFAPDDECSFRDGLRRLCVDESLRTRLGRNALRTIEERPFTWASNAARIEALARDLISRRAGRAEPSSAEPRRVSVSDSVQTIG